MTESGLVAYLLGRPGSDPETVATEVLAYLLGRSAAARAGLLGVCTIATRVAPPLVDVRRRPDDAAGAGPGLVGLDEGGSTSLVLLPKFWSGLPERQPVDDLRLLSPDTGGAVVVIAPVGRFTTLWAELRRRCRLAGRPVHGDHAAGDPVRWTQAGPTSLLMLVSWSAALAGIRASIAEAGDEASLRELDQLASLCDRIQSDAFQPLRADELAAATPRRLGQLLDLVDELATACEQRGLGRIATPGSHASPGTYSRGLRVGNADVLLLLSVAHWATLRETPFWLQVTAADGAAVAFVEERLQPLGDEIPPRLLRDPDRGHVLIPLFPPLGAERQAVVADLARQVEEVVRLLGEAPTIGFGAADGRPA